VPNFRRYYIPEAIIFITCVTRDRFPYLRGTENLILFWETLRRVQREHPFRLLAYVILPDHVHWLMRVDDPSSNFSTVMHSIKRNYTLNFKRAHHIDGSLSLWQARFWDHIIRNECDLSNHFDYIHWNPVKHGYVQRAVDWEQSTFRHWQERGFYDAAWGDGGQPVSVTGMELE